MQKSNQSRVIVDASEIGEIDFKMKDRLTSFWVALSINLVFIMFNIIMVIIIKNSNKSVEESQTILALIRWFFSGKVGLYLILSWFISFFMSVAYFVSAQNENFIISAISKALFVLSLLSLFLPIIMIIIVS